MSSLMLRDPKKVNHHELPEFTSIQDVDIPEFDTEYECLEWCENNGFTPEEYDAEIERRLDEQGNEGDEIESDGWESIDPEEEVKSLTKEVENIKIEVEAKNHAPLPRHKWREDPLIHEINNRDKLEVFCMRYGLSPAMVNNEIQEIKKYGKDVTWDYTQRGKNLEYHAIRELPDGRSIWYDAEGNNYLKEIPPAVDEKKSPNRPLFEKWKRDREKYLSNPKRKEKPRKWF